MDEELPRLPWHGREMIGFREQVVEIIQGISFQVTMALVIVGNALVIGVETDFPDYAYWDIVETAFLIIFAAELILKLVFLTPKVFFDFKGDDFTWNVFDFFIVNMGALDTIATAIWPEAKGSASSLFRMIRLLRILRIFRIIRFLRQLYMLAFGLVLAATAIFWVTFLMIFVLYVCAIVIVRTIGRPSEDNDLNDFLSSHFGSILGTMLTLFELMTNPDLTPYHDLIKMYPLFTPFLIGFIIFGSFGMIALLTGVISESMFEKNQMRAEHELSERENMRKLLTRTCNDMFGRIKLNEDGEAQREDVMKFIPEIERVFHSQGVVFTYKDFETMMDTMDQDGSGTFSKDEFFNGILTMAEGTRPISIIEIRSDVSWIKAMLRRQFEQGDPGVWGKQNESRANELSAPATPASHKDWLPANPYETGPNGHNADSLRNSMRLLHDESARQIRAMQEQHEKQVRLLMGMMREMKHEHEKQIQELQKLLNPM